MNIEITLQILQTIGICVGAFALVVIAIFAFSLWTSLFPVLSLEDEESAFFPDEEAWDEKQPDHQRQRGSRKS